MDLDDDLNAWRKDANCKGMSVDIFFPADKAHQIEPAAFELCQACPVRIDCLADATFHEERFGTWGGSSPTQRARLRRIARAVNHRDDLTLQMVRQVCEEELEAGLAPPVGRGRPRRSLSNVIDMASRRRSA